MNPFVRHDLPLNPAQREIFGQVGEDLFQQLKSLKISDLSISDYNKNYLSDYQKRLHYGIETGLYILAHALHKSGKQTKEISLIDHGGGTGLLSMLAVKCGFGTVIYNDIFEPSCKDSQEIAKALGSPAGHYVHGDIEDLKAYLIQHQLKADIMISRNVFEHIYDAPAFLKACAKLPSNQLVLMFATTSNPHNPAVNRYTRKLHRQAEWKGFQSRWGKASDVIRPFREVRKEIILSTGIKLKEQEINALVETTRGLLKAQIETAVKNYSQTQKLPRPYDDGTNTCDPFSGNWTERLTPVPLIQKWFTEAGFEFEQLNGFYDTHYQAGWKNLIGKSLNSFIQPRGKTGLFFCPFITLSGKRI